MYRSQGKSLNWYLSVTNSAAVDQIEIITSNKQKPNEDWLGFVVTTKAKTKIKDALKKKNERSERRGNMLCNVSLKAWEHRSAS